MKFNLIDVIYHHYKNVNRDSSIFLRKLYINGREVDFFGQDLCVYDTESGECFEGSTNIDGDFIKSNKYLYFLIYSIITYIFDNYDYVEHITTYPPERINNNDDKWGNWDQHELYYKINNMNIHIVLI